MSDIKWCDFGGHAFSVNDPEAETYAKTRANHNGDREYLDICGPCKARGMMQTVALSDVPKTQTQPAIDHE